MNLPSKSLWGNINNYNVISHDIYYIFADYGEGIILPFDKAKELLTEKAILHGVNENGFLYFLGNSMEIPLYESLKKRLDMCRKTESHTLEQIKEILQSGITSTSPESDYFGECPPPNNEFDKVRNGIYYIKENNEIKFAIHESVAFNDLTPTAMAFAVKIDNYLLYDHLTSTIPIFELQKVFLEVKSLMMSADSLLAVLNERFPAYVAVYNATISEENKIPEIDNDVSVLC